MKKIVLCFMLLIVGLFVVSCDLGGTTENPDD